MFLSAPGCFWMMFENGATHSPPGDMGQPDCAEGFPPPMLPRPHLSHVYTPVNALNSSRQFVDREPTVVVQ